jgi:pyruvate/2-oxoacid:ferredoxin oxidoreductase alpha subunit
VTVLDRADSPGGAPPLFAEVAAVCGGAGAELRSIVYGLGGRDLHPEDVRAVYMDERVSPYLGLRGDPCPV